MTVFDNHVSFFQTEYASVLTETGTIGRLAARGTYNPVTRRHSDAPRDEKYSGSFQVRPDLRSEQRDAGEARQTVGRYIVLVPATVDDLEPEDLITVSTSTHDSGLVGMKLRIVDFANDAYPTIRTVYAEKFSGRGNP